MLRGRAHDDLPDGRAAGEKDVIEGQPQQFRRHRGITLGHGNLVGREEIRQEPAPAQRWDPKVQGRAR
jgi:hypothetical protein